MKFLVNIIVNFQQIDLLEQPLADAIHYKKHDVIKLLEKHGAKQVVSPSVYESCLFIE